MGHPEHDFLVLRQPLLGTVQGMGISGQTGLPAALVPW